MYRRNDIVNFFAVDKFAFFNDSSQNNYPMIYPPERHNFFELQYVRKGKRTNSVNGENVTLGEGQLIIIPPNASHMLVERTDELLCYVIGFSVLREKELLSLCSRPIDISEDDGKVLSDFSSEGAMCFVPISRDATNLGCKIREGVSRGKIQMLKNRFEIFCIKLIEAQLGTLPEDDFIPRRLSVAENVLEYLKAHLPERVTLERISEELSLSVPYICREFKKKYDFAIMDYFLDMKIERAKQLIEESSLNFTQIADYLSFRSQGHFSVTFSKRVGISPSEYLKRIKSSQ